MPSLGLLVTCSRCKHRWQVGHDAIGPTCPRPGCEGLPESGHVPIVIHVCGTRAVLEVTRDERYLVTCADCWTMKHVSVGLGHAIAYATETSDRRCSKCGNAETELM